MDFGIALDHLRAGRRVVRSGWNAKRKFLFLTPGRVFRVEHAPLSGIYPAGTEIEYLPHIDMRVDDGRHVPWIPSQPDILANDWLVVAGD